MERGFERNAKMSSRRKTFSCCFGMNEGKETKTRLSSLTRKDFSEHVLNFLTTTFFHLSLNGKWRSRVGEAMWTCLAFDGWLCLLFVCAIDVIDWFDFYKFEVSQKCDPIGIRNEPLMIEKLYRYLVFATRFKFFSFSSERKGKRFQQVSGLLRWWWAFDNNWRCSRMFTTCCI